MRELLKSDDFLIHRKKVFIVRDKTTETEQAGYVDAASQIKRLLYAGENLMQYKRDFYDCPDGEVPDDIQPDPTNDYGFDPVDAQFFMESAKKRIQRRAEAVHASSASDSVKGSGEDTSSPETSVDG